MSFENFPYSNFHELNLDWILQKLKEAYSSENPPDYPVKSVNGMTGDVIIAIPSNFVQSVNGETGDVVLYRNPLTQFPATDETRWNLFRICDGTEKGIEFDADSAKRIAGTRRILIYDEENPPEYPVTSVNGQTGDVQVTAGVQSVNGKTGNVVTPFVNPNTDILTLDSNSPSVLWGISRNVAGGNVALYITTGGTNPQAFIRYTPTDGQAINLPLLTNADIPSSAGVVSVNTKTGAVTLYGSDILTKENGQSIAQDISDLKNDLYEKSDIIWERVLGSAIGDFAPANAACTPILETLGSVTIGENAQAVIYLYSGQTYIGKMNRLYELDMYQGSWGYYTGSVDVGKIIRDNSATGARIGVIPIDETIITDETVQTWGDNHCDVYLSNFETVSDANIIKSSVNEINNEIITHTQQITALQNTDTTHTQQITALQNTDTTHTQQITALQQNSNSYSQQIAELYTKVGAGIKEVKFTDVVSLPIRYPETGTDTDITENMACVNAILSRPGVQRTNLTIVFYNGYLTISGTIRGLTDIILYLTKV